ncbi:hypothetical protein ACGFIW_32700 [Micromonospora sp. NPDC048935]|uniref:hypothetical protein n=1 Tax=Micromonospora sp. NPDC048935 TaxID=3364262 RepID=UPI0037238A92
MVYRYESDEDAFEEYPEPGSDLSVFGAGPPPPAGPSPSRFPTPSLPRPNQLSLPSTQPPPTRTEIPPPTRVDVPPPTRADVPSAASRSQVYTSATALEPSSRRGGGRLWQVLVGGAAVLVLLALCGLGAAALIDRNEQPAASPTSQPTTAPTSAAPERLALDSRESDRAPLTAKELFPGKDLTLTAGRPSYQVLKTQSSGSCAVAATGEVADLLTLLGCNQVVRATLRTPNGDHLVTAGLFNLTDRASAERARDRIRPLLDERKGRFRGLAAGDGTDVLSSAPARVGWQVRGHYVAYALVVREDGATIKAGDATVREILFDMIELHLSRGVLQQRAEGGTAAQPTPESSASGDGDLPGE